MHRNSVEVFGDEVCITVGAHQCCTLKVGSVNLVDSFMENSVDLVTSFVDVTALLISLEIVESPCWNNDQQNWHIKHDLVGCKSNQLDLNEEFKQHVQHVGVKCAQIVVEVTHDSAGGRDIEIAWNWGVNDSVEKKVEESVSSVLRDLSVHPLSHLIQC